MMSIQSQERQYHYQLLARLFRAPVEPALLESLAAMEIDAADEKLNQAWRQLIHQAASENTAKLGEEFHQLFIGLGRGELMPYLSYYETGFLMEKPLARLRADLSKLGFKRQADNCEPEDHIAAIAEVMAMLIQENQHQQAFFNAYIVSWFPDFFEDVKKTSCSRFYPLLANMGAEFISQEKRFLAFPSERTGV